MTVLAPTSNTIVSDRKCIINNNNNNMIRRLQRRRNISLQQSLWIIAVAASSCVFCSCISSRIDFDGNNNNSNNNVQMQVQKSNTMVSGILCDAFTPVLISPFSIRIARNRQRQTKTRKVVVPVGVVINKLYGWLERNGEWEWIEDDPSYIPPPPLVSMSQVQQLTTNTPSFDSTATPQLPGGAYRPKQSLGQNYLKDPNTVSKIIRAFHTDATTRWLKNDTNDSWNGDNDSDNDNKDTMLVQSKIIELGPGAGALTDKLCEIYGPSNLHCIEIDERSVVLLQEKHPDLTIQHEDVLQVNYQQLSNSIANGKPLIVIGNLPYYITSQILFALADASHTGSIHSATVTMQKEVAQRMIAKPSTKEYGILSVVFQIYCSSVKYHFKIPPTVFYPQPKVDSALIGLHFLHPLQLQQYRLCGVKPSQLRTVVTTAFRQRRKTLRNSLKTLVLSSTSNFLVDDDDDHADDDDDDNDNDDDNNDNNKSVGNTDSTKNGQQQVVFNLQDLWDAEPLPLLPNIVRAATAGDVFAKQQALPLDWSTKRPEELTPGQFIELTRLLYSFILQSKQNKPESQEEEEKEKLNLQDYSSSFDSDNDNDATLRRNSSSSNNPQLLEQIGIQLGRKVWRKFKHGEN